MSVVFFPSRLTGEVKAPPSKSMAHRAVICAALADGTSRITGVAESDDVLATLGAVRAFGADVVGIDGGFEITGTRGFGGGAVVDCAESGSTLRFCVPIAAQLTDGVCRFVGRGRLGSRPMTEYERVWRERGLTYEDRSRGGALDLTVGGRLGGGEFALRGDISSQFLSGILFALPLARESGSLRVTTALSSRAYLDMTAEQMALFGVTVEEKDRVFTVSGDYRAADHEVEGDWSQAAFFAVANEIGSDVRITGLRSDSLQGDKAIAEMLTALRSDGDLAFDGEQCPDIMPVFAVACAYREGRVTRLKGLSRLKIKECDRLEATYALLSALGADIRREGDDLIIKGVKKLKGGAAVSSYRDHRMAMSAAIAALGCERPVEVDDCSCMSKSYPDFLRQYTRLGGKAI